ncbi:MAG: DUF3293 domain-containing protein [Pseudomonadota bacterium]
MQKKLLDAYHEAQYRVLTDPEVCVQIGVSQVILIDDFFAADSFCIITAYNPLSNRLNDDENKQSNEKLLDQVRQLSDVKICAPTVAQDPNNEWPDERGFLVANLSKEQALQLGSLYQQHAVVWMSSPVYRAELLQCSHS